MSEESETRMTIWMPAEMKQRIKTDHVDGRNSQSQYIRRAIRDRELVDELCADSGVDLPREDIQREATLERIISAGVEALDE